MTVRLQKVTSGGQTGVDRAALDVAMALNIPCGGFCPRGRRAEDGRLSPRYPLTETTSSSYSARTIQNVADSDGTLILTVGRIAGGTLLTRNTARKRHKPCLVVDLNDPPAIAEVSAWLKEHAIRVLNVAGPRASQAPEIYRSATSFLIRLFSQSARRTVTKRARRVGQAREASAGPPSSGVR